MRLESRIAWRSLASRPGRTFTSILGIAVGVATVLSVLIVDHNTILTEQLRRPSFSGKPDLEIRPLDVGVRGEVPLALSRDPALRQVMPVFFSSIRVYPHDAVRETDANGIPTSIDMQLIAVDPDAGRRFDAWRVVEGDDLARSGDATVLLSVDVAQTLGVAVGDVIHLQRALPLLRECQNGEMVPVREEKIQGDPEPFVVSGLIESDNLGRRRAVLIPFHRGIELFEGAHVQPIFWARMAPEAIYQDVRERLKSSFVVDKPKGALVGERVDQRAFRKSVRIAAALSLLLGLFVIYNAFSLSLVERVREIGLLRALGLLGREITLAVLLEGLLLAVLGAIAGLLLALGVVAVMKQIGITTLGFGKPLEIHDVPWGVVSIVLSAGVLAAMLGMVAPLLRVRRLSVIEAVRAGQIAYRPDPTRFVRALMLALLPGTLLVIYWASTPPLGERQAEVFRHVAKIALWVSLTFGAALLLPRLVQRAVGLVLRGLMVFRPVERPIAAASVEGAHHRVFGSTLGIALVLAAVLTIHGITSSLKDEAARFADRALSGRVFLQTQPTDKARIEIAAGVDGVSDFYSLSAEVHTPFPIRGVAPEHVQRWVPEIAGDPELAREFADGRAIVLSEFLAGSYGYRIGDEVSLSTFAGRYPVRVAAITDQFGYYPDDRNFAVLALATFRSLFCVDDERGTQYVFHLADGHDADGATAAIGAALANEKVVRLRTANEIRDYYLGDMRRDFWIFQVILILTGVLAVVGLWNALTVALLERRREIGLLRTLGFTPGQLGGMLAAESVALGLVGGALAVAAGYPISGDLIEAIRVISRLDVRFVASPLELSWVPALAVILALIATVPPALRVRSQVVASATRME